jgi:hypothetical protein
MTKLCATVAALGLMAMFSAEVGAQKSLDHWQEVVRFRCRRDPAQGGSRVRHDYEGLREIVEGVEAGGEPTRG